mgnify:CR=1 FL=1
MLICRGRGRGTGCAPLEAPNRHLIVTKPAAPRALASQMDGAAIAGVVIGVFLGLVLIYNIYWAIILVLERVSSGKTPAPRESCGHPLPQFVP